MLLRNSLAPPRAETWSRLSWEETAQRFRNIFLSGGEYDTGIQGAERLSRWRPPTASCATISA